MIRTHVATARRYLNQGGTFTRTAEIAMTIALALGATSASAMVFKPAPHVAAESATEVVDAQPSVQFQSCSTGLFFTPDYQLALRTQNVAALNAHYAECTHYPSQSIPDEFLKTGNTTAVGWLLTHGIKSPHASSGVHVYFVAKDHPEILALLRENNIPTPTLLDAARGGTEVGLFDIDDAGHIQYRSTYHLRSNDYYSARNYSSRLIGDKLVFYMPSYLNPRMQDPVSTFPAMRVWHKGANADEFRIIGDGHSVFRPATLTSMPTALHSVVTCDLAGAKPACDIRSVLGSYSRTFYVSPKSVYVWTHEVVPPAQLFDDDDSMTPRRSETRASVFQLPMNGGAPARLQVSGAPTDQFSFLEGDDGFLNVLVRGHGTGDAMWQTEGRSGATAMLRFPVSRFSGADALVPSSFYTELPSASGYTMQNRFVGDTVLWRNNDILDHTATDEAQGWDVAVPSGQSGEIVLQTPGTFAYICRYHPNMTGTIRVSP